MTGIPISNEDYPTRMDLYNKTKDFGNVLEEYDKGNRSTILSYRKKGMKDSSIQAMQVSNEHAIKVSSIEKNR